MELYSEVVRFLERLDGVERWPALGEILRRAAAKQPHAWALPLQLCQAVGGGAEQALPLAAALACLQVSIILVDDLLDEDVRGLHCQIGAPQTANYAQAFQALGAEAIAHSRSDLASRWAALYGVNQMSLTTAHGQARDIQSIPDEETYWEVVRSKSAPFYGTAFYLGALAANAPAPIAEALAQLGALYGEMVQIHDDLKDAMAVPANADWLTGRSPLPILFAESVSHPQQAHFRHLRQQVPAAEALHEAQTLLIRCGAISYCIDQLLALIEQAQAQLDAIPLAHPEYVQSLLDEVRHPVESLFQAIGS